MNILAVGDVVGKSGLNYLHRRLRKLRQQYQVDFTIANGENTSGTGITPAQADSIFDAGADVITLGNHVWNKRQIVPSLPRNCLVKAGIFMTPQAVGCW